MITVRAVVLYYLLLLVGGGFGFAFGIQRRRDLSREERRDLIEELRTLQATERLAEAAWESRQALWQQHREIREATGS